ncbi:MAG TPA: WYL domain-containing protein [bacterium]|jgi:predicted DNA-binding transcriptional regulator YafY|nr:WYL domain-containing protein [bacterium]
MTRGLALGLERHSFYRIHRIDCLVRQWEYPNVPKLSRWLEVSTRTIERDIEFLRDSLGAPLKYDAKRRGYYYTQSDFALPPVKLTDGELITLYLGQKLLSQYQGTSFENDLIKAFTKIRTFLPDQVEIDFAHLDDFLSFDVKPVRGQECQVALAFQQIARCLKNKKTVNVTYYTASRDAISTRKIDPYHLRCYKGAWYLIGYCHNRQEVRTFALDRIRKLDVTKRHFQRQPEFSLDDYLRYSLGIERGLKPDQVVIWFDAHSARFVKERVWHPTQELVAQEDGSILFKAVLSGLGEVKRWVLSYGSRAQVIKPAHLRAEIAEEATALAAAYTAFPPPLPT